MNISVWLLSLEFCQREVELRSCGGTHVIKLFALVKFSGNACFLDYIFALLHYFAVSFMTQCVEISLAVIDAKGNGFPKGRRHRNKQVKQTKDAIGSQIHPLNLWAGFRQQSGKGQRPAFRSSRMNSWKCEPAHRSSCWISERILNKHLTKDRHRLTDPAT